MGVVPSDFYYRNDSQNEDGSIWRFGGRGIFYHHFGQDFQLCGHLFFVELVLENYCELCINYHLLISVDLSLFSENNSGEIRKPTSKIEVGCVTEFISAIWSCLFLYFSVQIKCYLGSFLRLILVRKNDPIGASSRTFWNGCFRMGKTRLRGHFYEPFWVAKMVPKWFAKVTPFP